MKKSKFISIVGFDHTLPKHFEHVKGESMTIKGESYTIPELFERHLRGQLPNIQNEAFYQDTQDFDSIDFEKIRYADPFEKAELLQTVMEKAEKAKKAIEKWEKEQDSDTPKTSPTKKPKGKAPDADSEQGSKRSDATDASESASADKD